MGKIIHEQLSGAIFGIAMEILNELKPGLDEVLYERALAWSLRFCSSSKMLVWIGSVSCAT